MVIAALLRRLGEILVQERLTTPDVVEQALARAKTTGERVGEALVELGAVKSEDVLRALAEQQNLAYLSRDELPSPLPVVKTLSAKYLRQYTVCPVSIENGLLTVAIADPLNAVVLDDLRQFTGLAVKLVVSSAEAITEAIDRTYDGAATPSYVRSMASVSASAELTTSFTASPVNWRRSSRTTAFTGSAMATVRRPFSMLTGHTVY